MTLRLDAICMDAHDPPALARFWGALLKWDAEEAVAPTLVPTDDTGFRLRFLPTEVPRTHSNVMHFDLTSETDEQQQDTVARALEMGATHLDVGQLPEEGHVVLADPEGNEFCVLEAGNVFLADCPFLGAVAGDGTAKVGHFWSRALCWPLVWDQDEETAIQSPAGGPKITWGGPPLDPRPPRNRVHLDVVPRNGCSRADEVDRLVSLGARPLGTVAHEPPRTVMVDPDGNHFCVLEP